MTKSTESKTGASADRGPRFTIHEGYVKKGGQNTSYQITTRPGSPAPMKPASPGDTSSAPPSPPVTQER